ncbi:MAG: hypothetical protein IJ193_05765 [Bacilli bacterium]|nr:hypothetical protein [Bacilli bacterium]
MTVFSLVTYMILGGISFFVLLFLRRKYQINRLYNMVFSIFLLFLYATFFSGNKEILDNIFITFLFQFIFDYMYSTYVVEEDFFHKKDSNITYYVLLLFLGLFFNNTYFNRVDQIFLSGEDIRLISWGLLLLFFYRFLKENRIMDRTYSTSKIVDEGRILSNFTSLRKKYLKDINVTDLRVELAIYSVMIFHHNRRNSFLRKWDNFMYRLDGKKRRFGIMQIESDTFLSDVETINIVVKDFKKILGRKTSAGSVDEALSKYMGEDNLEVLEIYNVLKNFFKI